MNENSNPLPPQYQTPLPVPNPPAPAPAPAVPVRRRHSLTIIISLISAVLVIIVALIAFKTFVPKPKPTSQELISKYQQDFSKTYSDQEGAKPIDSLIDEMLNVIRDNHSDSYLLRCLIPSIVSLYEKKGSDASAALFLEQESRNPNLDNEARFYLLSITADVYKRIGDRESEKAKLEEILTLPAPESKVYNVNDAIDSLKQRLKELKDS